jgi:hypothetical protein
MKALGFIIAAVILVFGSISSRGANLDRISAETGVPVATLQAERASTGLGWGGLEKAHLLANESGRSFDDIVALHKSGEGWGKIAHNNGLNLGKVVSNARHSGKAMSHTQNVHNQKVHGKSSTNIGRGHNSRMSTMRGVNHGSTFGSAHMGSHGMHGMSGMSHGMGGMGHGGRGR